MLIVLIMRMRMWIMMMMLRRMKDEAGGDGVGDVIELNVRR